MDGKNDKWEWIKKTFPKVKEVIGDILPDKGVLGVVKNIISNDTTKSKQERDEALKHLISLEEMYLKDVDSARVNETKRDISEHSSWLTKNIHELIAIVVIGGWISTWYNKPIISSTEITGAVMLILGYLYGRSKPQS